MTTTEKRTAESFVSEGMVRLIAQSRNWQAEHIRNKNHIDAAACAIRTKALIDAMDIIKKHF